ncbi:N-acetylneuraminate synthase family protein [Prochlorococcus sp. AH-716-P20]|nr:N-acetylneuraminate synthase family protein [Prochlorococcus sp. AH-716-P20]
MKNIIIGGIKFNKINPLIVAEIGQAHEGSEGQVHALIDALFGANCNAIKFQIHLANFESSLQDEFRLNFSYEDETRYEYWKRIEFSFSQWERIFNHCKSKNIIVGASVFSLEALDIAKKLKVDFIKIGSGDLLFDDLINEISIFDTPVIISSGMANWKELTLVKSKFKYHIKSEKFSILHCTTAYPTDPQKIGFNNVSLIEKEFGIPSGLSDHSGNKLTSFYALAKGCSILEVHVNFDRLMFGPDSTSSLTIKEFEEVVNAKNYFQKLHIDTNKDLEEKGFSSTKIKFSRSIGIRKDMKKDQIINLNNIIFRKPGGYLDKKVLKNIIGKKAKHDLKALNILKWDDIEEI